MASDVDICNLALAHLGEAANVSAISPPDGSAEAEHCARFYPIARDTLLEFGWSFNTSRVSVALLESTVGQWGYAYARPNCLRVIEVRDPSKADSEEPDDYVLETLSTGAGVILTDVATPVVKVATRVTDTTKFSPMFTDALSWWLAGYLAGPIIKGKTGQQAAQNARSVALAMHGQAQALNANQRHGWATHTPDWMAAR